MKLFPFLAGLAAAFVFLKATPSDSAVLTLLPGSQTIEGITLARSGSATLSGRSHALTPVGAGLRTKKVLFVSVDVYVGQLLVSDAGKFVRTEAGALDSAAAMEAAAVQMTFLRDVDAEKIMDSFKDALSENNADKNSAPIAAFLDAVSKGGEAKKGKTLTVLVEKVRDGSEVVTWEGTQGSAKSVKGPSGLSKTILSIWLGKPADSGLEKLKAAFIQSK